MAIWIEVHRFSSRLLHHQLRWMCMEFSIGGQIRWSRQCMWSFRSEHVAGIWIDVYGIFKPWTTARSRQCVWNFQSADRSTNLLDVYRFFDRRVVVMTAVEVYGYFQRQRQTTIWQVFKGLGECQTSLKRDWIYYVGESYWYQSQIFEVHHAIYRCTRWNDLDERLWRR